MATGDIISAVVRTDGWSMDVTIEGFAVGATYDFGSLDDTPATVTAPMFSVAVVSEGYNAAGVPVTVARTVYGTHVVRVPVTTATIAGTYVSGTFVDGETVTQAVSGATAKVIGEQSAGALLRVASVSGTPNSVNIWSGATASFTASATPVTLPVPSKDELNNGTSLKVRVSLDGSVYADDKNGGAGTSGTNPTVTVSAGWATNTGGGAQTSAAATALSCTNNSTLAYPKVIAQWAWGHTPAFRRVSAAFTVGCIAYHGHGIACVALSATDAHAAVVSGTVTTKTDHAMSASGLHYESYDLAVPVASFTEGDDIALRFIAYPLVGDADSIIDTANDTAATSAILGTAQITATYKTTGLSTLYVSSAGNDSTGNGSEGNPYATIGKALAGNADIIYVRTGTVDILGSTPASVTARNYAVEVRPYPAESVTLTRVGTWQLYKAKRLAYIGIQSITYASGNGWLDGNSADAMLFFDSCGFAASALPTVGLGYRSYGCWFINSTGLGTDSYDNFSTSRVAYSFTGCSADKSAVVNPCYSFVANKAIPASGVFRVGEKTSGNPAPTPSGTLIVSNKLVSETVSSQPIVSLLASGLGYNLSGLAIIGNLIEVKSGAYEALRVAADTAADQLVNCIVAHNTVAGERANLFYNDTGTTATVRENVFCRNNVINGFAIKTDTFVGVPSGNRVGNWAQINGVNFSDNRYTYQASLSSFVCDYNGINVKYEDTGAVIPNEMGFTDDNSKYGDGTGNGDYMPTEASVLYDHTLRQAYQSFDLYGTAL